MLTLARQQKHHLTIEAVDFGLPPMLPSSVNKRKGLGKRIQSSLDLAVQGEGFCLDGEKVWQPDNLAAGPQVCETCAYLLERRNAVTALPHGPSLNDGSPHSPHRHLPFLAERDQRG